MDCFLERMGIALHLILPTLIKTEIKTSALTGGLGGLTPLFWTNSIKFSLLL